jgi:putative transposase
MVSAQARREQVDYAVSRGASVRRSCALLQVSRSSLGYQSKIAAKDAELLPVIREKAGKNAAYGYRFVWGLLKNVGTRVNVKRIHRIWKRYGFSQQRRRLSRKIRTGTPRPFTPTGPNQVWAYDFVHDRCANGQNLKCLTVIDEWTRESLAIEVASSMGAERVIAVLARLVAKYGAPDILRSDNGPEFIARAVRIWALMEGGEISTIQPGKPWQNASIESFNGTFRRELLDQDLFANLREAKILIEQYRWEYNHQRPHSSLNYETPAEIGARTRPALVENQGSYGSGQLEIAAPGGCMEVDLGGDRQILKNGAGDAGSEVNPADTGMMS